MSNPRSRLIKLTLNPPFSVRPSLISFLLCLARSRVAQPLDIPTFVLPASLYLFSVERQCSPGQQQGCLLSNR
ncbi:hypothetical protein FB446DRAFT_761140 [Lentinula raphanica]|nr:hypothetical protein FB446DRAFT_761140 [Lentinula raphanica]